MKLIITSYFETKDGIYSGIRHEVAFTSFTRLYNYLVKEYKQAKVNKNYIQVQTILK